MKNSACFVLVSLLLVLAPRTSYAQRRVNSVVKWTPIPSRAPLLPNDNFGMRSSLSAARLLEVTSAEPISKKVNDYRWEGLAVGSIGLGVGMAFVGHGFCTGLRESLTEGCTRATLGSAVIGATVGAVVGGLVGAAIHRSP